MANILVIDDDECIHESFKMVLEPENCVETASSGEEGVAKATNNPPDIIFLDLKMPGIGGIKALVKLQAICPGIPTLIMTAFYAEYMLKLEKVRSKGCLFELCRKPLDNKQLNLIVNAYGSRLAEKNYSNKHKQCGKTSNYERHFFQLFLAGDEAVHNKMIEGLRSLFDNHLNCYDLDVIDLTANPELAERDNIIATPTITIKGNCDEPFMVIGDMSDAESVLSGLNLI